MEYQLLQSFLLLNEQDLHPSIPKEQSPFFRMGQLGEKGKLNPHMGTFMKYLRDLPEGQIKEALTVWFNKLFYKPITKKEFSSSREETGMYYQTEEELKAAYDAEVAEMALIRDYSERIPEYMRSRWGEVPSEISAYLNGEPEFSVLKKVVSAFGSSSSPDDLLAIFEKAVSASQASRA